MSTRLRSERLEVRTTKDERDLIDRAVAEQGTDLTEFVISNLTVAVVGDVLHSRVARSQIHALTTLGVPEVRVIGPRTLLPANVAELGVQVHHDMARGLRDADVVIMLRLQNERMNGALLPSAQEFFKNYGLTPEKLALS